MRVRKLLVLPLALLLFSAALVAGSLWLYFYALFKADALAEGVYVLQPRLFDHPLGARSLVVRANGPSWIVVDTPISALGLAFSVALNRLGTHPVAAVANTHWHPDHTGSNGLIAAGAPIYARDATARYLRTPQSATGLTSPGSQHTFAERPAKDWPTQVVEAPARETIQGVVIDFIPVPGGAHTDGDLLLHFPELNVLAVGDAVWPGQLPFADTEHGGNVAGLVRVLEEAVSRFDPDTSVVSGHAKPTRVKNLVEYQSGLEQALTELTIHEEAPTARILATSLVTVERFREMLAASGSARDDEL